MEQAMTDHTVNQVANNVPANDAFFVRPQQAAAMFNVSLSHLYALAARGEFPAPVKISKRASGFYVADLKKHAEKLAAQANTAPS